MFRGPPAPPFFVIPAQAGIQTRRPIDRAATFASLDSRLRGNDGEWQTKDGRPTVGTKSGHPMLLIFGLGYTAARIAATWPDATIGTTRDSRNGTLRFDDEPAVRTALATATHILSSVPPEGDADPVLSR